MTLKCTGGMDSHCNQVNLESPLVYIGGVSDLSWIRRKRYRRNYGGTTASGVARAWICGPSTIPIQVLATSTESLTRNPDGNRYTMESSVNDIDKITPTESFEDTPTAIPITTSRPTESRPGGISATTEASDLEQNRNSNTAEGSYDCDIEVEDDCCIEIEESVREPDPCAEECFEVTHPSTSLVQTQRRARSEADSAGNLVNKYVLTKVITITEIVRPVTTIVPPSAMGVIITEAILIASTTYTNQSSRCPLSEITRPLTIMPPSGTGTSSGHPKTSSGPRVDTKKGGNYPYGRLKPKVIGAIIGSLLGTLMLIGLLWCYRFYLRGKRARRLREYRESNPVSSRITASSYT